MSRYWRRRRGMAYYQRSLDFVRHYAPQSVLDVGGGVGIGCQYLAQVDCPVKVSLELAGDAQLAGVQVVKQDFLVWQPDRQYDVVMCLQVLEHLHDPATFAAKLFECAVKGVVISVPYLWERGACSYHVQDPIDDRKLGRWIGRPPSDRCVATTRLIVRYDL